MDERWTSDGAFVVCAPRLPGATAGDSEGDSPALLHCSTLEAGAFLTGH